MTLKNTTNVFNDSKMENYSFQNPEGVCLEEVKVKKCSSNLNKHGQEVSALDASWCNTNYKFTLYTPVPTKDSNGEFTMGSKQDWLDRVELFINDGIRMLKMEYHRFWSEVTFNKHFLDGINSFLKNAPPFYSRDIIPCDTDIVNKIKKAHKLVLLVLVRLTTQKESKEEWMRSSTLGNILYDNFVISIPQLMEISSIYSHENFKEVSQLITRVLEAQPKYIYDIEKSTRFIGEVFSKLEAQLSSFNEANGDVAVLPSITGNIEIAKLVHFLLDTAFSMSTFLQACPQAASVFHEQNFELRIASLYEITIPALVKHLESQLRNNDCTQEEYFKYQFKIDLCRHQLILAVNTCLTCYMSVLTEARECLADQDLKAKVDVYLNIISDLISNQNFVRDYNSAFPVKGDIATLSKICPDLDFVKRDYINESLNQLQESCLKKSNHRLNSETTAVNDTRTSHSSTKYKQTTTNHVSDTKITGVELESLVTEVKDILPHLGDGFVAKCLEYYNYVSADVVDAVLSDSLPDALVFLDIEMPLIPPEDSNESIPDRINVFDNDEFDIMTRSQIDTSRIHRGKRQNKHKNLFEMLDDKSHVNELRDVYQQLSVIDCVENDYEDEYDDTYDDVDANIGNGGETEAEERRPFVIPRVLRQQKQPLEEQQELREETKENVEDNKADLFIENPADIREIIEQRRRDQRGGVHYSRGGHYSRDVVGNARGQGQDKEVIRNREFKNSNKATRGNHNRRYMADRKRRQGMFPS